MIRRSKQTDWRELTDEELMAVRVRDLGLQVAGSVVEPLVNRLYDELQARDIAFRPPCYLADEWLCPDKVPIIGIPFYLVDPRLKRLEKKMMLEVEGGAEKSFMRVLRHECGHAINYAYELYRKTRWRELFGHFSTRYSDTYDYQPYSRRFVTHLEDHYAQAHPDEDFAETFAVWLTPGSGWSEKYGSWPVIKKLRYVDNVMKKLGAEKPKVTSQGRPPWSAAQMTSTLAAYYDRKRKTLGKEFRGYYDDSLREVFSARSGAADAHKASQLLRRYQQQIVTSVSRWTGHRKYDINLLITRLVLRCDALDLHATDGQIDSIMELTTLVTTIASNTFRGDRRP